MTNKEKYKLLDAVIEASRDNIMGGKYRKAYESGVINAYNRLVEATNKLVQQPKTDRVKPEINRVKTELEPCEDCISDPCEGCRYELNSTNGNPCYSCGKYKLTEQQPTSDDEIIKALKAVRTIHNGNYAPQIDEAIRRLTMKKSAYVQVNLSDERIQKAVAEAVEKMKAEIEAQPCEDCISILNRIMEYTYGMLTTEKIGLQHLIKSMMDEMSGGGEDAT